MQDKYELNEENLDRKLESWIFVVYSVCIGYFLDWDVFVRNKETSAL